MNETKLQKKINCSTESCEEIDTIILWKLFLKKHGDKVGMAGVAGLVTTIFVGVLMVAINTEPLQGQIYEKVDKRIQIKIAQMPSSKELKQVKDDIQSNKKSLEDLKKDIRHDNEVINEKLEKILWHLVDNNRGR